MKEIIYFISILFVLLLFGCSKIADKPSMVSIDSIRQSSCEEIHSDFQDCRLEHHINILGLLYITFYPILY